MHISCCIPLQTTFLPIGRTAGLTWSNSASKQAILSLPNGVHALYGTNDGCEEGVGCGLGCCVDCWRRVLVLRPLFASPRVPLSCGSCVTACREDSCFTLYHFHFMRHWLTVYAFLDISDYAPRGQIHVCLCVCVRGPTVWHPLLRHLFLLPRYRCFFKNNHDFFGGAFKWVSYVSKLNSVCSLQFADKPGKRKMLSMVISCQMVCRYCTCPF